MAKRVPVGLSYHALLKEVREGITRGLAGARQAYYQIKVVTYWRIGQSISRHLEGHGNDGVYTRKLINRLSGDLDIGERLLYHVVQFYNSYPEFEPAENLKWSHYKLLAAVKDEGRRDKLGRLAAEENLSKRKLELIIKEQYTFAPDPSLKLKPVKTSRLIRSKGKLYTYRAFKDDFAENVIIDCGFNIYHESDVSRGVDEFVETVKTGQGYEFRKTTARSHNLYTYKAFVLNVVDGDTIWVMVDCGFKLWTKQKLRLRGIDTDCLGTGRGEEAKRCVQRALKGLSFVVIKSFGRDKYGRYLADVFYQKGMDDPHAVLESGEFLNQQLLDVGLAVRALK